MQMVEEQKNVQTDKQQDPIEVKKSQESLAQLNKKIADDIQTQY